MYSLKITDEIKAVYTAHKGDPFTGCPDDMEIDFFILGVEISQPKLHAVLDFKYRQHCWEDLKARIEWDRESKVVEDWEWLQEAI